MNTYLHFIALGWLIALFVRTPIAFPLSNVLGKVVACPLCLGWYLGFALGVVHLCNGLVPYDWYFPLIGAMVSSGSAFLFRVLLDVVDVIHTRVLLWESK